MPALLTATHLTRQFGRRIAVSDVSFDLVGGEILALLGPNGAGKTTTLRMLAGLIGPTSGEVRIEGQLVSAGSASHVRTRIGMLTESPGLWDRMTVRENLMTYARLYGLTSPESAVARQLDAFDLTARAGDLTAQLSKGMRQRAALARTLLHEPPVVLLDEPTSGLDPESAHDVRALMRRLREDGRAVLVSTHNLDEVERLADRVAIIRTRLIAIDAMSSLRARAPGRRLRIGLRADADRYARSLASDTGCEASAERSFLTVALDDGTASPGDRRETPAIVRRLVEMGAEIESVTVEEPSLEDVYLRLLNAPAEGAS